MSKYTAILPRNILSVNIIEITHNETIRNEPFTVIIAQELVQEKGVRLDMRVKHIIIPSMMEQNVEISRHIIEILDGDARGTRVTQNFSDHEIEGKTRILVEGELKLQGVSQAFGFIPKPSFIHGGTTIIQTFADFLQPFSSTYEQTVDSIYREILLRPADDLGLNHYSKQLESGEITEDEVRQIFFDSEE